MGSRDVAQPTRDSGVRPDAVTPGKSYALCRAPWLRCVALVTLIAGWSGAPALAGQHGRLYDERTAAVVVQQLVDRGRTRLAIAAPVDVVVVATNARLASVQPRREAPGRFVLSIEARFLGALEPDDLEAVVAHELGHVWIYTHRPYLQTEQLANRIAMRLVSRQRLERVYEQMWNATALPSGLASFLGVDAAASNEIETAAHGADALAAAQRQP